MATSVLSARSAAVTMSSESASSCSVIGSGSTSSDAEILVGPRSVTDRQLLSGRLNAIRAVLTAFDWEPRRPAARPRGDRADRGREPAVTPPRLAAARIPQPGPVGQDLVHPDRAPHRPLRAAPLAPP